MDAATKKTRASRAKKAAVETAEEPEIIAKTNKKIAKNSSNGEIKTLKQTRAKKQAAEDNSQPSNFLDRETMLAIYRTMYTSRRIDDKEIQLSTLR